VTTVVVVIAIVAVGAFITALIAAGVAVKRMEKFMEDWEK
jgi:hypothetical protein